MNSRERIQTTLSHREPDLIPYDLAGFQQLLNERPVREFNYKTPNQVLFEKIALITLTYNSFA